MKSYSYLILILFLTNSSLISGQDVGGKTLVSQSRTTISNIGKCDITIKYHSPSVNGRKIFGGIVPYDFVVDGVEYPWRAGSNQRTTIDFSHDVEIEGHSLPAGSYGFLVLVNKEEWTLIFSSGKSWGAFNYDKANDVLRVPVKTQKVSFQEWLSYDFLNPKAESVAVQLRWEETAVVFSVTTNAVDNIILDLTVKQEKAAADYQELAIRTLEKDPRNHTKALQYLESSFEKIDMYEDEAYRNAYLFNYMILKGELLITKGEVEEGQKLIEEAKEQAAGFNSYYYGLNKLLVKGKQTEAFAILNQQIEKDPNNRANYLAMGEYYLHAGDQRKATENFQKAYECAKGTQGENYCRYLYLQNKLILERGG